MQEDWVEWNSQSGLSPKYYVTSITDDEDGLKLMLSDSKDADKTIQVFFKHFVHAYRSTDESFMQKTILEIHERYGKAFYTEWTFFKVENSSYLQWLAEQSFGIINPETLTHFVILAADSVVEIITAYEPEITFLS